MYASNNTRRKIRFRIKSTFPQDNLIPNYVDYPGQLRESWIKGPVNEQFQHILSRIEAMPETASVELLLPDRSNIDSEEYFSFMSARITLKSEKTTANLQLSYVGVCATLMWHSEKQEKLLEPPVKRWEQALSQIAKTCEEQGVHFIPANDSFFKEALSGFRIGVREKSITIYDALFFFEYC